MAATAAAQTSPLFVVHFETGPSWNKSLAPSDQPSFREHSANLNRLRKEGAIVFGARYGDLGMIFLKADTLDAAKALIDADPGVQSGIFAYRIAPLQSFLSVAAVSAAIAELRRSDRTRSDRACGADSSVGRGAGICTRRHRRCRRRARRRSARCMACRRTARRHGLSAASRRVARRSVASVAGRVARDRCAHGLPAARHAATIGRSANSIV